MMKLIKNYTSLQDHIRVICTVKPLRESHETLFSKQLKSVFKTVITVPAIDKVIQKFFFFFL